MNVASVVFDMDMVQSSVTDSGNYRLKNVTSDVELQVGQVTYDSSSRTARLQFEPLAGNAYELVVGASIESASGRTLEQPYTTQFTIYEDLTAQLPVRLRNSRLDRLQGTMTADVSVANTTGANVGGPIRLVFEGLSPQATLVGADGSTDEGFPYFDVVSAPTVLADQSLAEGQTLSLRLTASGLPSFATLTDNGNGTGLLHFATTLADRGNYPITVRATDDGNGNPNRILSGTAQFVFTASSDNAQPVLAAIGNKVAVVDEELSFLVEAADVDQDALTFSAQGMPSGTTLTSTGTYGEAIFRWTPSGAGDFDVTIRVDDSGCGDPGKILFDSQTIHITARTSNQSPLLAPIGRKEVSEGQTLELTLSAFDPDGDSLLYRASPLLRGASLDPHSGLFRFTPDFAQAGSYSIRFEAGDGNRTSVTDPDGNTTTFEYDGLNRLFRETNMSGKARVYQYDRAGNLREKTDRDGRVIQYAYDPLNHRTTEEWLDQAGGTVVRTITTAYDAMGRLRSARDPDAQYTYTYDDLGAVHSISNAGTPGLPLVELVYGYDRGSRVTSVTAEVDGQAALTNQYLYNAITFRLDSLQQSGSAVSPKRVDYSYFADAYQVAGIARYADLAGSQLVASSAYGYNARNLLESLRRTDGGGAAINTYTLDYDSVGRLEALISNDGQAAYNYYDDSQLASVQYTDPLMTSESYGMDSADQGAANPPTGILNGGFDTSDPQQPQFGWKTLGASAIAGGRATLGEGGLLLSDLSQTFLKPASVRTLEFTLESLDLHQNGFNPPDAFEVALLAVGDGTPLVGSAANLTGTDALLNIQPDGRVWFAPTVTVPGATSSGEIASLTFPLTMKVDVSALAPGAAATLLFDLAAFGEADSTAVLDNVKLTSETTPSLAFTLDPATDSGATGDDLTCFAQINLVGTTDPLQAVLLDLDGDGFDDGQTTADSNGQFTFTGLTLAAGANLVRLQATNENGTTEASRTINIDSQPPVGHLVAPAAGQTTEQNLGYIDVQWTDPGLAGLDAVTLDAADVTISGVTVDEVEQLDGGRVRYWYNRDSDTLSPGTITVTYPAGQVADRAANTNPQAAEQFVFESQPARHGTSCIGLYDPDSSRFYLKCANTTGYADLYLAYGEPQAGRLPVAGDWNGDATHSIGLYDPAGSIFHLRNSNDTEAGEIAAACGEARGGWKPVVGRCTSRLVSGGPKAQTERQAAPSYPDDVATCS